MNNLDLKIMYAVAFLFALWISPVQAETSKATPVDQLKAAVNINEPNNAVTVFLKNEWEDIKYFHRINRVKSQAQLERNKKQVKQIPANLKKEITETAMGIGEFVQSITGVNKK